MTAPDRYGRDHSLRRKRRISGKPKSGAPMLYPIGLDHPSGSSSIVTARSRCRQRSGPAQGTPPMIEEIEGPQSPDRQGADLLTIPEVMAYYHGPGRSVAVTHDSAIHWTKSWGVADVENGAPATDET